MKTNVKVYRVFNDIDGDARIPKSGRPPEHLLIPKREMTPYFDIHNQFTGLHTDGYAMYEMLPNGGKVEITLTFGNVSVTGTSLCSMSDNFVRETGYKLAWQEAMWKANKKGLV